ncbi:DUF4232 domain-containing protein [Streptomyces sp. NBC_00568]|uniref:DUF4232 domain-containing protein n=1 Tax=Streptomyces sp. NBC_00568 TaxID=2975779 RepID=UPI0022509EC7|nr:DUF4232 domain-containing protein [Streptomyces sp. NBC_00568]MCX4993638.1 DUF4232 domain-containing protein [Streptomyces sp. NBC_00568]
MSPNRVRLFTSIGLLATVGIFLTACNPDAGSSSSAASAVSETPGKTAVKTARSTDGTFSGTLSYWAPGKLRVGKRAFWVAEDTAIQNSGGLCGNGSSPKICTADELDAAAKKKSVKVKVTIKSGIATTVIDQTPRSSTGEPNQGNTGNNSGNNGTRISACLVKDLKLQSQTMSRPINHIMLVATNQSSRACTISSYPFLFISDDQNAPPRIVEESKPKSAFVVKPNEHAFASINLQDATGESDGPQAKGITKFQVGPVPRKDDNTSQSMVTVATPGGKPVDVDLDVVSVSYWLADPNDAASW